MAGSLPVPSLWLDVFQKLKSLGYTGVSFYIDWALLEGKQGDFTAEGVFAFEPFFEAAGIAGIYLLAVSWSFKGGNLVLLIETASWALHQCRGFWRRVSR